MSLKKDALELLKETSRTFYIPINRLPPGLKDAVASAYLCMRAIDEIEDDPDLDRSVKIKILQQMSALLQSGVNHHSFGNNLNGWEYYGKLPEVSLRLAEWATLAPETIAPRIWDATAAMADRMAYWVNDSWQIHSEADLNRYTFSVAGAVGLLLSDLWAWYDGTNSNRTQAIAYGRGLQAVNILRNHNEDLIRGVDFYPKGWQNKDMHAYAKRNLSYADAYTKALPAGPALDFCLIPLTLAHATLEVMDGGLPKLSRHQVMHLIAQVTGI